MISDDSPTIKSDLESKLLLDSRQAYLLLRGIIEFGHLPEASLLLMGSDIIIEPPK